MEPAPSAGALSPPKKKIFNETNLDTDQLFEAAAAGASREINGMFAKFTEVLCEKAATDTSKIQELEGILIEARNLEAHLNEKKKVLRQTLALISEKLSGHEG